MLSGLPLDSHSLPSQKNPFEEPFKIIETDGKPSLDQITVVKRAVSDILASVSAKQVFEKREFDFLERALPWLGIHEDVSQKAYQLQLAQVFRATKNYKKCNQLFNDILKSHPKSNNFRTISARILGKMGLHKLSCKVFNRAILNIQNEINRASADEKMGVISAERFSRSAPLDKDERVSLAHKPTIDHMNIRSDFTFDSIKYGTDHIERMNLAVPKGWINSDFFRNELRKAKNPDEYREKLEATKITVPINFRYQSLEIDGKKESGFFRLGVITDHRNGFTNYKQLKYFKENDTARTDEIVRLKQLQGRYKKDSPEYLSIGFAIHQLEHINNTIATRRDILQKQMFQLIQAQALKHPDEVILKRELSIVHMSLLNPQKMQLDKTGWAHFENNEIEDMREIFAEFEGKKVVFDGNGVHFADDRNDPEAVVIKTIFFNISVQGHQKNDSEQKLINQQALQKVYPFISSPESRSLFQKIQLDLNQGKSSYTVAEDISTLLMILKLPTSIGCLSAKDRTGYVAYRTQCRMLARKLDESTLSEKQKKQLNTYFGSQGLGAESGASLVVEDNTSCRFLKVSPFTLPGLSESLLLQLKRIREIFRSAISLIKSKK